MDKEDILIEFLREWCRVDSQCVLNQNEWQLFSQSGEDGLLQAILQDIGQVPNFCVEFGAGDGRWCNTSLLLTQGWRGFWIEADKEKYKKIASLAVRFDGRLAVKHATVNIENVNRLLSNVPHDFGVLSIDIDGNDYHVLEAIDKSPAIVIIEYNGRFPPGFEWVMPYKPDYVYDDGKLFGASLHSLMKLAEKKGYCLVATTLSGVNAFFVREDLAGAFSVQTEKELWHPLRKWLIDESKSLDLELFSDAK